MIMDKNRFLKVVLLSVAVSGTMVSCQKDEMVLPSHEMSQKNLAHVNTTLRYWIDGVEYSREFASQEEMSNFISYLIGFTVNGKKVTIDGSENPSYAPEENDKLTFTTSNKAEMDMWAVEMVNKGYTVTVVADKKTGLYTGTATKGGSRTTMAASLSEERE